MMIIRVDKVLDAHLANADAELVPLPPFKDMPSTSKSTSHRTSFMIESSFGDQQVVTRTATQCMFRCVIAHSSEEDLCFLAWLALTLAALLVGCCRRRRRQNDCFTWRARERQSVCLCHGVSDDGVSFLRLVKAVRRIAMKCSEKLAVPQSLNAMVPLLFSR